MYIHIGNREVISDKKAIGIFNTETMLLSENNSRYFKYIEPDHKSITINKFNHVLSSKISSYTIIKRVQKNDEVFNRGIK